MYPLVAVVQHPLPLPWATNRPKGPVDEPEAVVQGGTFTGNSISILPKGRRIQHRAVPLSDLVGMILENKINNVVADHAENRHGSSKSWN